ncbi:lytic transglycosylase domain-containing protein [Streptomyces sp. NPDC046685]|uniref:lytic transglycosylase domain-containing protein n=1 Tax=Streptomyces sp. NPDC046685 TaxID=3157202 RepID=UPI0033E71C81
MASSSRSRWTWLVVPMAALAVWALARGGAGSTSPPVSAPRTASPNASPGLRPSAAPGKETPYEPADYAGPVRTYAEKAGLNAQLLMAILYNESYKPHDPEWERAWQSHKPDAAFGIANMHRAAFDETRQGRDFAARKWEELPDDRPLAVEAAAWYLHDLEARLPARWSAPYTRDELLALGYNTGGGNMLAFARGARPGSQAQSYLDRLHDNWAKAGDAVQG